MDCPSGYGVEVPCTEGQQTVCKRCDEGHFAGPFNHLDRCRYGGGSLYRIIRPSNHLIESANHLINLKTDGGPDRIILSSDRIIESDRSICRPCSKCGHGLYEKAACTIHKDTECGACAELMPLINENYIEQCLAQFVNHLINCAIIYLISYSNLSIIPDNSMSTSPRIDRLSLW